MKDLVLGQGDVKHRNLLLGLILFCYAVIFISAAVELPQLMALALIAPFAVYYYYRPLGLIPLLFLVLPFSIEIYFDNGLGTDLPTEPIILLLFIVGFILIARRKINFTARWSNYVLFFLFLHFFWSLFSALFAENQLVSFKYCLAKSWYIVVFFLLCQHYFSEKKFVVRIFEIFGWSVLVSAIYVFIRHAMEHFAYDKIGYAVSPFFRNHVNYSIVLCFAIAIFYFLFRHRGSKKYLFILIFLGCCLYLSYARASYVAVVAMVMSLVVLKLSLWRIFLTTGTLLFIGVLFYATSNHKYVKYAPQYERTISHYKFDNLIKATYRGQDISTMERLNRWVAGGSMIKSRPWTGFGPNNFYFAYRPFMVNSFKTYVSDNPEKSGVHNYYLMTAIEQGIPGFIIFLFLIYSVFIAIQDLYCATKNRFKKSLLEMLIMIFTTICVFCIINDLIEAVKVGSFFFLIIGIVYKMQVDVKFLQEEKRN